MERNLLSGLQLLIVEDDPLQRKRMAAHLEKFGADIWQTEGLISARTLLKESAFDFIFLDVNLPDGLGTSLLEEKELLGAASVIVLTANAEVNDAVQAIKLGALDYLVKPIDFNHLALVLKRANTARLNCRVEQHQREKNDEILFTKGLDGLKVILEKIIASDDRLQTGLPPVLLEGETGTGKTTLARWIHQSGPRREKSWVEVNCSTLPESLAESELFGHEKGAFTDARNSKIGLFEAADGGTLFLDELASLSLPLQSKVLKAIEEGRIRRIGKTKDIPIDTRIIAASNRPLKELVRNGEFREDLFHRLSLFCLEIPPLRERRGDIEGIALYLLQKLKRKHRLQSKAFSKTALSKLTHQPWPGNVRELSHEIERALVLEDDETLEFNHLDTTPASRTRPDPVSDDWFNSRFTFPERGFDLEIAIQRIIQHALDQTHQNVSAAARILGVNRDYIRYRIPTKRDPAQ